MFLVNCCLVHCSSMPWRKSGLTTFPLTRLYAGFVGVAALVDPPLPAPEVDDVMSSSILR